MRLRLTGGVCALALAVFAAGCAEQANTNMSSGTNANVATTDAAQTNGAQSAPDNSEIVRAEEGGVVTETRTFRDPNAPVERVVVTTREGRRTARVYYRNEPEPIELAEDKVADALTATASAVADFGRAVGSRTADAAAATREGAEAVGERTVDGARAVGERTADGARAVGERTADGARTAGAATRDAAETVGERTADGARAAGRGVRRGARATGRGARRAGEAVRDAVTP